MGVERVFDLDDFLPDPEKQADTGERGTSGVDDCTSKGKTLLVGDSTE